VTGDRTQDLFAGAHAASSRPLVAYPPSEQFVANYDDLAEEALGQVGSAAMQVITLIETFGIATCFVVLHSVNWPTLLSLPPTVWGVRAPWVVSILMVACAFPLTLLKVKYLALFSPSIAARSRIQRCSHTVLQDLRSRCCGGSRHHRHNHARPLEPRRAPLAPLPRPKRHP
jgi:hypothetical protein